MIINWFAFSAGTYLFLSRILMNLRWSHAHEVRRRERIRELGVPALVKSGIPGLSAMVVASLVAAIRAELWILWWVVFAVVSFVTLSAILFVATYKRFGITSPAPASPTPDETARAVRSRRRAGGILVLLFACWLYSWRELAA